MARRETGGATLVGAARRSRRTGRPQEECMVSIMESAHRHGFVQLGVLVIRLLSGLLGARSTARGSVRLGASEGGGRDADHRWCLGEARGGDL